MNDLANRVWRGATVAERLQRVIRAVDAGRNGRGAVCTVSVGLIREALAALQPGEAQGAEPVALLDETSIRAKIGEIGNQIHNLACEHQNDDALSEHLGELRSQLWALATFTPPAAQVTVNPEAVKALASYQQADMDGIIVKVSRQAIEERLPSLRAQEGDGK